MKKNTFLSNMTKNDVVTENGMAAHSTTDSAVLDLFFLLGTRPSGKPLLNAVDKAWAENKDLTLKCLFQSRDVRGGKGERDSFRQAIAHLASTFPADLVKLIPEYGRFDDMHTLLMSGNGLSVEASNVIEEVLTAGLKAKEILQKIESMTEEQCGEMLKNYA